MLELLTASADSRSKEFAYSTLCLHRCQKKRLRSKLNNAMLRPEANAKVVMVRPVLAQIRPFDPSPNKAMVKWIHLTCGLTGYLRSLDLWM